MAERPEGNWEKGCCFLKGDDFGLYWGGTGMIKKVVSGLILCVVLFVSVAAVWAAGDYYGLPEQNFDIVFTRYVDNYVAIAIKDMQNNQISTLTVNTARELRDQQCKIVVTTNCTPNITITFNLLTNTDTTITDSNTIAYTVSVYQDDGATPFTFDGSTEIRVDGVKSCTFQAGETGSVSVLDYEYPLGFKFETTDLDNAAPGDYVAEITVGYTST